jgi:peroxiredoxin Q/BCP
LFSFFCFLDTTSIHVTNDVSQKTLPYPLLSDRKRLLIGALGAADGAKTKRSHFVFGKGGVLLDKRMPVKPADR